MPLKVVLNGLSPLEWKEGIGVDEEEPVSPSCLGRGRKLRPSPAIADDNLGAESRRHLLAAILGAPVRYDDFNRARRRRKIFRKLSACIQDRDDDG